MRLIHLLIQPHVHTVKRLKTNSDLSHVHVKLLIKMIGLYSLLNPKYLWENFLKNTIIQ